MNLLSISDKGKDRYLDHDVLPPRQDTTTMKRSFPGMLLEPLQLQVLVELWADGPR